MKSHNNKYTKEDYMNKMTTEINQKKQRKVVCFTSSEELHKRVKRRCLEKNQEIGEYFTWIIKKELEKEGF